jgi:hypothetical protein
MRWNAEVDGRALSSHLHWPLGQEGRRYQTRKGPSEPYDSVSFVLIIAMHGDELAVPSLTVEDIPAEVWVIVCSHLGTEDLKQLGLASWMTRLHVLARVTSHVVKSLGTFQHLLILMLDPGLLTLRMSRSNNSTKANGASASKP